MYIKPTFKSSKRRHTACLNIAIAGKKNFLFGPSGSENHFYQLSNFVFQIEMLDAMCVGS